MDASRFPSAACRSLPKWMPSTTLAPVTSAESNRWQPTSAAMRRYSAARPTHFAGARRISPRSVPAAPRSEAERRPRIFRDRHLRLEGGTADGPDDRRHAFRRMPGGVRVHGLEIVRPQHDDDGRKRGVRLDPLFHTDQAVTTRLVRILIHRPPPVQAVLDDPDLMPRGDQCQFQDTRPAQLERGGGSACPG